MKPILADDSGLDAQGAMRRMNLRRALQLVFLEPGQQTRAGIARATGLTPATSSSLVAELIENRFVVEGEQAASTGGKRATTLSIDDHLVMITMVVHQTEVIASVVGLDGAVLEQSRMEYLPPRAADVLADIATKCASTFGERLLVASVQLPGATDGRTVLESVQLDWRDLPLAARLQRILGVPVLLVNDVDAEAIAEATTAPDQSGYRVFIHLGVGIGATTMLDGVIAPGPRARAGEIGHVQVIFGDAAVKCGCGLTGCLESASSMVAMLGEGFSEGMPDAQARALAASAPPERLEAGAVALARTIKLISAALDPAEVVLGGSAGVLGEPFLDLLRRETAYAASGTDGVHVRFAHPQSDSYLGAAQYALTTVLGVRWSHPATT